MELKLYFNKYQFVVLLLLAYCLNLRSQSASELTDQMFKEVEKIKTVKLTVFTKERFENIYREEKSFFKKQKISRRGLTRLRELEFFFSLKKR